MKRKGLSLVMAGALLAGALAGCSTSSPSASTPDATSTSPVSSSTPAEPVKLTLWHSMTDDAGPLIDGFVRDFNAGIGKEKGIEVEAIFQGSYSDATTKLRAILQNDQKDQLPDVMQIDSTGIVDYMSTDYSYTVDEALADDPDYDLDGLLEVPLVNWNYNGVQLGMPFSSSTTVLYYNKTMLEAAGFKSAPTTFQGIIDIAAKLPKQNAVGAAVSAYAGVPNSPSLANWIGQMPGTSTDASYLVDSKNGRAGAVTKLVCDGEGTLLTFLTEWKKMYDAGAVLNQSDGLSDMFIAGQLAFLSASSSNLNTLLTSVGENFEIGSAYLPRVDDKSNYGATVSGSGMFMFDKGDDAQKAASWEFTKYLLSADVQAAFSTGTGYFPSTKAAFETDTYKTYAAKNPQFEIAVKQVNETSPDMLGITIGPSWDFYMEIQNQTSAMLDSGTDPAAAATEMASVLNGILEQYNRSNG